MIKAKRQAEVSLCSSLRTVVNCIDLFLTVLEKDLWNFVIVYLTDLQDALQKVDYRKTVTDQLDKHLFQERDIGD